jgi:hypothetical protein
MVPRFVLVICIFCVFLFSNLDNWFFVSLYFRFRLKLRVSDGSGQAVFVLFDGDVNFLLGKHCHELVSVPKVCLFTMTYVNVFLLCSIELICFHCFNLMFGSFMFFSQRMLDIILQNWSCSKGWNCCLKLRKVLGLVLYCLMVPSG